MSAAADRVRDRKKRSTHFSTLSKYVAFAIVSVAVNLGTQEVVLRLVPSAGLAGSIVAGTAVGFALKYVLDKFWIFHDDYQSSRSEARKVVLYGLFSIVTTLIFWGFELAFWTAWGTSTAKYTGAVVGLTIGYAAKFCLDRAFVFREQQA